MLELKCDDCDNFMEYDTFHFCEKCYGKLANAISKLEEEVERLKKELEEAE